MSYANLILYSAVIPSYHSQKEQGGKAERKREVIDMNDPRNEEKLDQLFEHIS